MIKAIIQKEIKKRLVNGMVIQTTNEIDHWDDQGDDHTQRLMNVGTAVPN